MTRIEPTPLLQRYCAAQDKFGVTISEAQAADFVAVEVSHPADLQRFVESLETRVGLFDLATRSYQSSPDFTQRGDISNPGGAVQ